MKLMRPITWVLELWRRAASSDAEFHAQVRQRMAEWRRLNLSPADYARHAVALHETEIAVQLLIDRRRRHLWSTLVRFRRGFRRRAPPKRYDVRLEYDQTWTVYDIFTGLPYELEDQFATGLKEKPAAGLKTLLNRAYGHRLKERHIEEIK